MRRRGVLRDELEALYRAEYARFVRVAAGITSSGELARDAVQEAFASAWRNLESFRNEGPLEARVWRAVVNAAKMQVRSGGVSEPVTDVQAPAQNGRAEDEGAFDVWLAALPEGQRLAVFLRYYADLDYRTIASVLDVSDGTVGATLNTALGSLRRALEEVPR